MWSLSRDQKPTESVLHCFAYSIYCSFEHLIPDAPDLMQSFLAAESDAMSLGFWYIVLYDSDIQILRMYVRSHADLSTT